MTGPGWSAPVLGLVAELGISLEDVGLGCFTVRGEGRALPLRRVGLTAESPHGLACGTERDILAGIGDVDADAEDLRGDPADGLRLGAAANEQDAACAD